MCWLCGVAVPAYAADHLKHRCSLVRAGVAPDYDYCSNCFTGEFLYGELIPELPTLVNLRAEHKLYVVGSWSTYSAYHELEEESPGVWTCVISLGASSKEWFNIVLDMNSDLSFYPIVEEPCASSHLARIVGPDALR
eukprot:CAMPEP_0180672504 /NCGR_PEP_ID=MMETSP1037_2-20121125/65169_1 /TAXON_ID=632150 /ORGANISM="Azadinium spinosum, Strain 3D9" /LENGTH=136 /DNA_ID=CAMNT_0022701655 /DNA_START=34 /DNA_END=440 /DNA_ORIENTATION=+